jgi:hypothetical protein
MPPTQIGRAPRELGINWIAAHSPQAQRVRGAPPGESNGFAPRSVLRAHRPLEKSHNPASSLSHVETRQVRNDYTLPWNRQIYQIERQAVVSGLRGATVRVEQPLDLSLAVRYGERYLPVQLCPKAEKRNRNRRRS